MSTSFDSKKNQDNQHQSQSSTNSIAGGGEHEDKRGESVTQLKLREKTNQINNTGQFSELENLANDSQQVKQLMGLQESTNKNSQQYEPIQKKKNNTGLPDNLKSGIENLSGHSMNDVKVHHNSDKPAQLQASAYAQGTDIHLGPGQEKHLPHEAWHVAQQKQGRVEPTTQMKGNVNVNDDAGLEKEADVMGAKAASFGQRKSENQETLQLKSSNDGVVQFAPPNNSPKDASVNKKHQMNESADGKLTPKDATKTAAKYKLDIKGAHTSKKSTTTGKEDTEEIKHRVGTIKDGVRLSSNLIDAMIKATQHFNRANAMLPDLKQTGGNYDEVLPKFKKEMEALNNLKETWGQITEYSGGEPTIKDIQLLNLAGFNKLYIDPDAYIPTEDMKKYQSEFSKGAGRLDNILDGKLSGTARDFGKIWMGDRGATFFAPIQSTEAIIEKAKKDRGIYTIGDALKLGTYVFGWLDQSLKGGEISNPDHKIVKIFLTKDPFEKVVDQSHEIRAWMPKGTESGAYPGLWQPGGSVKNEGGKDSNLPQTKEVAIAPMNISEFVKYLDEGIFELNTISLEATVKNANPEEEAKKLGK